MKLPASQTEVFMGWKALHGVPLLGRWIIDRGEVIDTKALSQKIQDTIARRSRFSQKPKGKLCSEVNVIFRQELFLRKGELYKVKDLGKKMLDILIKQKLVKPFEDPKSKEETTSKAPEKKKKPKAPENKAVKSPDENKGGVNE